MNHFTSLLGFVLLISAQVYAQSSRMEEEFVDSASIARIMEEGTERSQVMRLLEYVADVYGPRLTWSPGFLRAAEWTQAKFREWGLDNIHREGWTPRGRGWTLRSYSANVLGHQPFPLLSYPKAWSPGTRGMAHGDVVLLDAVTDSALEAYRGALKNKFVLLGGVRPVKLNFEADARRYTDAQLLELANAEAPRRRRRRFEATPELRARAQLEFKKLKMCEDEGALAILSAGSFDGGSIMVQSAGVTVHPDTPRVRRPKAWDAQTPAQLPQVAVAVEHYNRMVRMIQKGERLRIQMNLEVDFFKEDSGYNVIAELPGTDLKDEVVMIGGHLDSWHAATGATDNGSGVAVCMEAMRILKALNLSPRRTIRVALWGGEEQGEYGSRAYVQRHFLRRGTADDTTAESTSSLTQEGEKLSVYFNDDNGSGKFRGIYLEGIEAARPIFRRWFSQLGGPGDFTLSITGTGSTDHTQFLSAGLPGFQFIQDDLEYFTRTWHSTMDLVDHALEEDLKQAAVIMAAFAYNAAMREGRFPRRE